MPNSLSQYLPSTDYCIKEICTYGTIKCPWYWSKAYKQYTIIQNKHFNLKSICICNGYCILLVVYIGKSSIFSFFRETFTYYFLYSAYLTFLPCTYFHEVLIVYTNLSTSSNWKHISYNCRTHIMILMHS